MGGGSEGKGEGIASVQALSCQHSREKGRRKRRERKEREGLGHYTACCNLIGQGSL